MTIAMITSISIEDILHRIVSFNDAWHFFREESNRQTLPEWGDPLIENMRETKAGLQILLLREYHHLGIWLVLDPKIVQEETYSVRLSTPINGRSDACHIPKRIAIKYLTEQEHERFTQLPERP